MQKRILIVDDDENVRLLVRRKIEGRHFQVDEAACGSEAIAKLLDTAYHLIILDLVMPQGGGHDVLEVIGRFVQPPKCIIISSLADVWDRQRSRPPYPVLPKPFPPDRLLLLVQDELGILEV